MKKKHKRFLIRSVLFIVTVGSGYVLYNPSVVKDDAQRAKVESIKSGLVEGLSNGNKYLEEGFVNATQSAKIVEQIPKGVVLGDQEINVDEVVVSMSKKLEELPTDHYKEFKAQFCADLVATAAAASK